MNRSTEPPNVTSIRPRLKVKSPLTLSEEDRRQFVRLEVISPMQLRRLKDVFGQFRAEGEYDLEATMLNLSMSGVLIELSEPLNEGDIVIIRFESIEVGPLEAVPGLVKRCDSDEDVHLAGIQFLDRSELSDHLSGPEFESLPENCCGFRRTVRQVLEQYLCPEAE